MSRKRSADRSKSGLVEVKFTTVSEQALIYELENGSRVYIHPWLRKILKVPSPPGTDPNTETYEFKMTQTTQVVNPENLPE